LQLYQNHTQKKQRRSI